jgi:predicted metal-dependent hydrolase
LRYGAKHGMKHQIFGAGPTSDGEKMDLGYTLLRSRKRRKTISLQLGKDGRIVIRAPFFTPRQEIDAFFRAKEPWLRNRLQEREKVQAEHVPRSFTEGDTFFFLGEGYPLRIEPTESGFKGRLLFDSQCFMLQQEDIRQGREIFIAWYLQQAERHLGERLNGFSRQLGLVPRAFRITAAQSFWGSCSAADRLAFNWRLIMAPRPVIDYVIVHELQHLVEKNHSAAFWKRVALVLPNYGEQKRWLRKNGPRLNL